MKTPEDYVRRELAEAAKRLANARRVMMASAGATSKVGGRLVQHESHMIHELPNQPGEYHLLLKSKDGLRTRDYDATYNPRTQHWLKTAEPGAANIGWASYIVPHDTDEEWIVEAATLLNIAGLPTLDERNQNPSPKSKS